MTFTSQVFEKLEISGLKGPKVAIIDYFWGFKNLRQRAEVFNTRDKPKTRASNPRVLGDFRQRAEVFIQLVAFENNGSSKTSALCLKLRIPPRLG